MTGGKESQEGDRRESDGREDHRREEESEHPTRSISQVGTQVLHVATSDKSQVPCQASKKHGPDGYDLKDVEDVVLGHTANVLVKPSLSSFRTKAT
jgi:hypothetical protein